MPAARRACALATFLFLGASILYPAAMAANFYGSAPNADPQRPDYDLRARGDTHLWKSTTYGYYTAFAVYPDFTNNPPDDFDIEVYSDYDIQDFVVGSYIPPSTKQLSDFAVVYNPNGPSDQKAYFTRILFFSGGGGFGNRYDYEADSHSSGVPAGQLAGGETAGPLNVGTDRASGFYSGSGGGGGASVVNAYDVYLYAGGRYNFTLSNLDANAHYDLYVIRGAGTANNALAKGSYDHVANPDVDAPITDFIAPTTGWYGFIVLQAENQLARTYTIRATGAYDMGVSPSSVLVPLDGDEQFNLTVMSSGVVTPVSLGYRWTGTIPSGVTVQFAPPSPVIPSGVSENSTTVYVNTTGATPVGTYPLRLYANDTGVGSRSVYRDVVLTVSNNPDFSLAGSPSSNSIAAGSSAQYQIHVNTINSFSDDVTLNASCSPSTATINFSFSPNPVNGTQGGGSYNATVTVNTTGAAPSGTYSIVINATNGTGTVRWFNATLSVGPPLKITIVQPSQNELIGDEYTFRVQATSGTTIKEVRFTFSDTMSSLGTVYPVRNAASGLWEYTVNTNLFNDGIASMNVTAVDSNNVEGTALPRSFMISNVAPSPQILWPLQGTYLKGSASINVSVGSQVMLVQYRIDDGGYQPMTRNGIYWTGSWNTTTFPDGQHSLTVVAKNARGQSGQSSITLYSDNIAPTAALVEPVANQTIEGVFTFKALASDLVGVAAVNMTVFGSTVAAIVNPTTGLYEYMISTASVADGTYSLAATAYDHAGGTASAGPIQFFVDNTPPALVINSPTGEQVVSGNFSINASVDDVFVKDVVYKIDAANWQNMSPSGGIYSAVWDTSAVVDGSHTITVRARDRAFHETTLYIPVRVDNTPPEAAMLTPYGQQYAEGMLVFKVSAIDTVGVRSVVFETMGSNLTAVFNPASGFYEYTLNTLPLPDGNYSVVARVTDQSGKITRTDPVTYYIDNHAPTLGVGSPGDGSYVGGMVDVGALASDLFLLAVEYRQDGLNWIPMNISGGSWNASWDSTRTVDGQHNITVRAMDHLGHATFQVVTVLVDNNNPTTSIAGPAGSEYVQGTYTFRVAASDALGVANVTLSVFGTLMSATYNAQSTYYEVSVVTMNFPDGAYTLSATAIDRSGRTNTTPNITFFLDNHAPVLYVLGPGQGVFVEGGVAVSANTTDAFIFAVEYRVDSSSWTALEGDVANATTAGGLVSVNWTAAWGTSGTPDGRHRLTIRATDGIGHSSEISRDVVVDNTPPACAVASPVEGQFVEGMFTVRVAAGDTVGIANVSISIFGARYAAIFSQATGYFECTLASLTIPDGTYPLVANATDLSGKSTASNLSFCIDNRPPALVVASPVLDQFVSGDFMVDARASDMFLFSVEYKLDSGDWAKMGPVPASDHWNATWPTRDFFDGRHLLRIRATDLSSHATEANITVTVDNTPPLVTISNPVAGQFVQGTFTFQVLATDIVGIDHVELDIYGMKVRASYNAQSGFYEYTLDTTIWMEDAVKNVSAAGVDLSGKVSTAGPVIYRVDNYAPILSIESPASGGYVGGQVDIVTNVTDAFAGPVEYNVDSSGWVPVALAWNTLAMPDGPHSLEVRARDLAGHQTVHSLLAYVDNAAPSCALTAPIRGQFVEGSFRFSVLAADANGIKNVTLAVFGRTIEIPFNSNSGYFEYLTDTLSAPDGNYTIQAVATDRAGKRTPSDPVEFNVDNNAPVVLVRSPLNGGYVTGELPLQVEVNDTFLLSVRYSIDDGGLVPVEQPWNTTLTSDGEHTIGVRASDMAGHVTTQTVTVFVDNLAPEVTILAPLNASRVSGPAEVRIYSGGSVKRVSLAVDGGEFLEIFRPSSSDPYLYNLDTTLYPDGLHRLTARSVDFTGHEASSQVTVFVDNTPPLVVKMGPKGDIKGLVTFKFNVTDNSTIQGVVLVLDGSSRYDMVKARDGTYFYLWSTGLGDNGRHIFEVRATDSLGNEAVYASSMEVQNPPDYWSELLRAMPFIAFLTLVILLVCLLLLVRAGKLQRWVKAREDAGAARAAVADAPKKEGGDGDGDKGDGGEGGAPQKAGADAAQTEGSGEVIQGEIPADAGAEGAAPVASAAAGPAEGGTFMDNIQGLEVKKK